MIERLASASGLVLSATASGAGASVAVSSGHPLAWLIPVICGCIAALIVRGIIVTKPTKRKKVWRFEALVTALVVLLTAVIVEEKGLSPMWAVWTGMGLGGAGFGVVTIARTSVVAAIKTALSMSDDAKP
jgi:hypothetical protein